MVPDMLFLVRFPAFHWFVYDFIALFVFRIACLDFEYIFKIFHSSVGRIKGSSSHTLKHSLKNNF